jgi:23S rRNA maturation mini-RNase III
MRRLTHARPSPALVVAVVALVAALVGTAVAEVATTARLDKKEKKQTRKIARKQINKLAPGLSVANADTADNATNAENAQNAVNAQNAENANNATNAQNADTLDGKNSTAFETFSAYGERTANLALTAAFQDVTTASITTSGQTRVLANGSLEVEGNGGNDDDAGCRIQIAGTNGPENNFTIPDTQFDQDSTSVDFSRVLPAGTHNVALQCDEAGAVVVDDAELIVLAIPE